MNRFAVVTLVNSPDWNELASITQPSQRAYAQRLGAEFVVMDKSTWQHPHYDKWHMFELLDGYERLIYLDADTIVRLDCPDLFVMVPPQYVAGENELLTYPKQTQNLNYFVSRMGWTPIDCPYYLNGGVLVISRVHRDLFRPPEAVLTDVPWPEQNHFNARLIMGEIPVCFLPSSYNDRYRSGEYLRESFILHYSIMRMPQRIAAIGRDLAGWDALFSHSRSS